MKRPIFLHTLFLSSCFHLEFKALCLRFEIVNFSMDPLWKGCTLKLPFLLPLPFHFYFQLFNKMHFHSLDLSPCQFIQAIHSFFIFFFLKLFNVSLHSNLTPPLTLVLRPSVLGDPLSCKMDGRTISTNIDSWFSRSCKKASGQGVQTHPSMVLSAMVRENNQLVFY